MPFTNFPDGITSFGVPYPGGGIPAPFTGNYYFVQEPPGGSPAASGGDGSVDTPFTNLQQAINAATDGNNDVIMLIGSVHVSATVTWNKSNTHLVGVCAPLKRGKRARISSYGNTAVSPMVNVTGNGCFFSNVETFYGYGSDSALICWEDQGGRNCYNNMEFLGFGSSNTAGQAGSRAFLLTGSTGECRFSDCVFGTDTVARTAANYTLEIAGDSPRNYFENCTFESYLTGSGAGGGHLLVGSAGIDRYLQFNNCRFLADIKSGGSLAMTQAFNVSASAGGLILCNNTWLVGCTNTETSASGNVYMTMPTVATSDSGLAVVNAP